MGTIDIQYFSDIHTEFFDKNTDFTKLGINVCAPYLIIAGDIGNLDSSKMDIYQRFLTYVANLFKYVIIIAGNHEYYNLGKNMRHKITFVDWSHMIVDKITQILTSISTSISKSNIIFLNNSTFDIPETDICIYGTTLWSHIPLSQSRTIKSQIADYRLIPAFNIGICNQLYSDNIEHIKQILDQCQSINRRLVMITHHLPSYSLIDSKYQYSEVNCAFASQIDAQLLSNTRIVAWIAGHSHTGCDKGIFHINPIGYPDEKCQTDINYNKIISLSDI